MIRSLLNQAETETRAALEGLTEALDGPALAVDASLVAFRVYGDALRLRVDAPAKLRRWAEACGPALLDDVLRAALSLVDTAELPADGTRGAALDPVVGTVVRDRDHAESVLHALRRVWLPRPVSQLSAYAALVERMAGMDGALARLLTRAEVEQMLGHRVAFGAAWIRAFPDGDAHDDAPALQDASSMAPSPTLVARYIEGGLMQGLVERIAEAKPSFAAELATAIEAMRAARQAGFIARKWQQKHATGVFASGAFHFTAPPLAHAAASGGEAVVGETHRLGKLFADLDADAMLIVGEREIRLEIDFEPGSIARIALGDEERVPAGGDTACCITIPRAGAPVRLEVVSSSGQLVAESLSFAVAEP